MASICYRRDKGYAYTGLPCIWEIPRRRANTGYVVSGLTYQYLNI